MYTSIIMSVALQSSLKNNGDYDTWSLFWRVGTLIVVLYFKPKKQLIITF